MGRAERRRRSGGIAGGWAAAIPRGLPFPPPAVSALFIVSVSAVLTGGCAPSSWPRSHSSSSSSSSVPVLGVDVDAREAHLMNGFVVATAIIPREPAGPKPALIEAGGRDPAMIVEAGAHLLRRGIVVVHFQNQWPRLQPPDKRPAPAPPPAEEKPKQTTVGSWLLAAPRPGIVGRSYFRFVAVSARTSVPAVVDHLQTVPDVDPARIAVAGRSTGGFIALEALVNEPRLAAGIVQVACGDYHDFLEKSSLALAGDPRWLVDGRLVLDAAYEAELRTREPVRFAERFPPRPVLMLNGGQDPAIPASCARHTAAALGREYERGGVPERFRFVLYEGAGHDLGSAAKEEELDWFERWLLDPG
jgi:dienelactone hydrolase